MSKIESLEKRVAKIELQIELLSPTSLYAYARRMEREWNKKKPVKLKGRK